MLRFSGKILSIKSYIRKICKTKRIKKYMQLKCKKRWLKENMKSIRKIRK